MKTMGMSSDDAYRYSSPPGLWGPGTPQPMANSIALPSFLHPLKRYSLLPWQGGKTGAQHKAWVQGEIGHKPVLTGVSLACPGL